MKIARAAALLLLAGTLAPPEVPAQWDVIPKAALPSVPYWWTVSESRELELIPLLWTGDLDGSASGCCVVGGAVHAPLGMATIWAGVAFGTGADGGAPAGLEAAVELDWGAVAFRRLHGRWGASLFVPLHARGSAHERQRATRVSAGLSILTLDDERYLGSVPFFSCPGAPAVPCQADPTPYPWSPGRDVGLAIEGTWGAGSWDAPRLTGSAVWGVKAGGGDHAYVRAELDAAVNGTVERFEWQARLAAGWAAGGPPLQRRFLLSGADPVTRWLNPYIDVPGALFEEISYFVPGGPNLRAYIEAQPLVDGYLSANGSIGKADATEAGFWGRIDAFFEAAWTPGVPDRLGPEELNAEGALLFDWRQLPAGEGEARGRFLARVLEPPQLWADAGFALKGGYKRLGVAISLPLWASDADFADAPTGDSPRKPFALRWAASFTFNLYGGTGY